MSMAMGSFLSGLRSWAAVDGGYGLEAPTHLLRALYLRDHCAIQVPGVPAAIGVSRSAVSLWLEGKVGVPRPVAMLLRMLVAAQRRVF